MTRLSSPSESNIQPQLDIQTDRESKLSFLFFIICGEGRNTKCNIQTHSFALQMLFSYPCMMFCIFSSKELTKIPWLSLLNYWALTYSDLFLNMLIPLFYRIISNSFQGGESNLLDSYWLLIAIPNGSFTQPFPCGSYCYVIFTKITLQQDEKQS